jgi:GMP synthase-like glutamine amidotransferase
MTDTIDKPKQKRAKEVRAISYEGHAYPELWCHVYIVGDEIALFPRLFALAKCWPAKSLEEADLVLFTGGIDDVSPELYGKTHHRETYNDYDADVRDIRVFREAVALGIPMVGVCRGAQFLHVMNGGELFQHVDNHNSKHDIWLRKECRAIESSSVHHQMCKYNPRMEVLADAIVSTQRWRDPYVCDMPSTDRMSLNDIDIEAFWYEDTACFGVQGHPEYAGFDDFTVWFLKQIEDLIVYNPDLEYRDKHQRLKEEIIAMRDWEEPELIEKFMKEHG